MRMIVVVLLACAPWRAAAQQLLTPERLVQLVRVGAPAGVLAAFASSALLHFVPVALACGARQAAWMGMFFLAHGAFVVLESKLGLGRLRPAAGWALTMLFFAATAPLFVEPALQALGK